MPLAVPKAHSLGDTVLKKHLPFSSKVESQMKKIERKRKMERRKKEAGRTDQAAVERSYKEGREGRRVCRERIERVKKQE